MFAKDNEICIIPLALNSNVFTWFKGCACTKLPKRDRQFIHKIFAFQPQPSLLINDMRWCLFASFFDVFILSAAPDCRKNQIALISCVFGWYLVIYNFMSLQLFSFILLVMLPLTLSKVGFTWKIMRQLDESSKFNFSFYLYPNHSIGRKQKIKFSFRNGSISKLERKFILIIHQVYFLQFPVSRRENLKTNLFEKIRILIIVRHEKLILL